MQSIDIPQANPLFNNLPQSDGGGDSDSDNEEDEPINKDELFAIIDVEEDIDAPTELWETPGMKQLIDRINKIARINPERFKQGLKKPVARNPPQPEGENNTQEGYRFGSGPSDFPQVGMEAMRKEFAIFIQQPILFQKCIDEDMKVCFYPIQHECLRIHLFLYPGWWPLP